MTNNKESKRIRMNSNSGHITVMISLMLSAIIIFMLSVTEGMHIYMTRSHVTRGMITASESVMADYDRYLLDNYGILAVDEGYNSQNPKAVELKLNEYMLNQMPESSPLYQSLFSYTIDEINIDDRRYLVDDSEYLLNEIRELMKYKVFEDGISAILESKDMTEDEAEVDGLRQDVIDSKAKEEAYDNAKKSEENDESEINKDKVSANARIEDPRKTLKDLLKKGTLSLIIGENNISSKEYDFRDLFDDDKVNNRSHFKEKKGFKFKQDKDLTDMLVTDDCKSLTADATNLALTIQYIKDYFPCYKKGVSEDAILKMEYLVAGRASNLDNLKDVVNRIIAVRFVSNYVYLSKSIEHQTEAREIALALVGATANPGAVELVTYLLLAVLAYAESIIDIRQMLDGDKIPLIPNQASFKLNFKNLASKLATTTISNADSELEEKIDKGVGYEDYLIFFILANNNQDLKYKRMLTLMDADARKNDENFDMNRMLFSYRLNIKASNVELFKGIMIPHSDSLFSFQKTVSY
ncbi:MAG: DUF5702 domain-containing protein [Lachnospiraceae bacterium]|nr:DUF5702 domain-containing protein [Lachnospiraceae bacterium]